MASVYVCVLRSLTMSRHVYHSAKAVISPVCACSTAASWQNLTPQETLCEQLNSDCVNSYTPISVRVDLGFKAIWQVLDLGSSPP